MARPAKKQAAQKLEEPEEAEGWEDAVVDADGKDGEVDLRLRDWRDVERFREMKDLRRLVDDDYGLEEIFHVPLKPRVEVPPRTPKLALPAKLKLVAAQKAADPKTAAKTAAIANDTLLRAASQPISYPNNAVSPAPTRSKVA